MKILGACLEWERLCWRGSDLSMVEISLLSSDLEGLLAVPAAVLRLTGKGAMCSG